MSFVQLLFEPEGYERGLSEGDCRTRKQVGEVEEAVKPVEYPASLKITFFPVLGAVLFQEIADGYVCAGQRGGLTPYPTTVLVWLRSKGRLMNALNGAYIAAGMPPGELAKLWMRLPAVVLLSFASGGWRRSRRTPLRGRSHPCRTVGILRARVGGKPESRARCSSSNLPDSSCVYPILPCNPPPSSVSGIGRWPSMTLPFVVNRRGAATWNSRATGQCDDHQQSQHRFSKSCFHRYSPHQQMPPGLLEFAGAEGSATGGRRAGDLPRLPLLVRCPPGWNGLCRIVRRSCSKIRSRT